MSTLVGLDISMRHTGIVVMTHTQEERWHDHLPTTSDWTDREVVEHLAKTVKYIGETYKPTHWFVERHYFGGATAARMQWIIGWLEGHFGLVFQEVKPAQWKKPLGLNKKYVKITASGKQKNTRKGKRDVVDAMEKRFGAIEGDFERRSAIADARGIALYGCLVVRRDRRA